MRLKPISLKELLAADDEHGDVDADLAVMEEQAIAELEADLAELHDEEEFIAEGGPVLPVAGYALDPHDLESDEDLEPDEEDFDDNDGDGWGDQEVEEDFNEDVDELEDAIAGLHQNLFDLEVMPKLLLE